MSLLKLLQVRPINELHAQQFELIQVALQSSAPYLGLRFFFLEILFFTLMLVG
jgi:hypothetical protein